MMKKVIKIVLTVSLLVASTNVFAQNTGRMQIKQAGRGAENAYRGFNVKIIKGGVTALSPEAA